MTFALAFWVLMLIWFVFGMWQNWGNQYLVGGNVLLFLLLMCLGWHEFGPPIHN
jgi:hypothetical protein